MFHQIMAEIKIEIQAAALSVQIFLDKGYHKFRCGVFLHFRHAPLSASGIFPGQLHPMAIEHPIPQPIRRERPQAETPDTQTALNCLLWRSLCDVVFVAYFYSALYAGIDCPLKSKNTIKY